MLGAEIEHSEDGQDMRCRVESILQSTLAESDGILPRESWTEFLQIIGGSEDAEALLKDQTSHLSVKEFLNVIYGPKESDAPEASAVPCAVLKDSGIAWTDNLRYYFQKQYRQGGEFRHPDYVDTGDADLWTWMHRPTGIHIWQDAIDLTSGEGGEVYFHYTSELAFRNITAAEKKAAEVWASLNSDPGPKQNAWWGKGVYSVPHPPDQWRDREQLLDNNFRNMMARDRAAPDKGPEYVEAEYPKRVAFCVPIIINAADAYDVSVRATPEMQAAGKEPGRNLGDKLLNAPGMPQRCCVVLRVNGEDGVTHAQGQLLDALRRRADCSTDPYAKYRLGGVLLRRGLYAEALPVLQEVLKVDEWKHGPESYEALASMTNLAALLHVMGRYSEALELERRSLEGWEAMLGPEHRDTLIAMGNLAGSLHQMGRYGEAEELQRKALEVRSRTLGPEHPETLESMSNLGLTLDEMGSHDEAAELHRKALELRGRTLGPEHPETLQSMGNLGFTLDEMGSHDEAAELQQKTLKIMKRTLGPEHPSTLISMSNLGIVLRNLGDVAESEKLLREAFSLQEASLGSEHLHSLISLRELAVTLHRQGELNEALQTQRRALSSMERTLRHDHSDTEKSRKCLEELLHDMNLKEEDDKQS